MILLDFLPFGMGMAGVLLLGWRGRQVMKVLSKLGVAARVLFVALLGFLALSLLGAVSVDVARLLELGSGLLSLLLGFL